MRKHNGHTFQEAPRLLRMAAPLVVGFASQSLIAFTDAALVAHVGAQELAGVTLAISLMTLPMLFGLGVITALSPELALAARVKDSRRFKRVYFRGVYLSVITGMAAFALLVFSASLLSFLDLNAAVVSSAAAYLWAAGPGVTFFLLYVNVRNAISAAGQASSLTWILVLSVPLNFGLASLLIFGVFGTPALGVIGAGASSTAIRIAIFLLSSKALTTTPLLAKEVKYPKVIFGEVLEVLPVLKLGVPIGIRITLGEGFIPVVAFLATFSGPDAVTAQAVAMRLIGLSSVAVLGFSAAATVIASWARAESDAVALSSLRWSLLTVGAIYSVLVCGCLFLSFDTVASTFFNISPISETGRFLQASLLLILTYMVLDTLGSSFSGFLVGMLDTFKPLLTLVLGLWGVGLGVAFLLVKFSTLGYVGIWVGLSLGAAVVAVINFLRASHPVRCLRIAQEVALSQAKPWPLERKSA